MSQSPAARVCQSKSVGTKSIGTSAVRARGRTLVPICLRRSQRALENKHAKEDRQIGLTSRITRRDFLNSSLLGSGAALLSAACPMHAIAQGEQTKAGPGMVSQDSDTFSGYGGVGDYADANGNTLPVVQSAHRVRDGFYQQNPKAPGGDRRDFRSDYRRRRVDRPDGGA